MRGIGLTPRDGAVARYWAGDTLSSPHLKVRNVNLIRDNGAATMKTRQRPCRCATHHCRTTGFLRFVVRKELRIRRESRISDIDYSESSFDFRQRSAVRPISMFCCV
jgi:hypothetical protein